MDVYTEIADCYFENPDAYLMNCIKNYTMEDAISDAESHLALSHDEEWTNGLDTKKLAEAFFTKARELAIS